MVNHILRECNLIGKFLSSDRNSDLSGDSQVLPFAMLAKVLTDHRYMT